MMYVGIMFVTLFLLGLLCAPFPYWPSYFLLWKNVFFNHKDPMPTRARVRHIKILLCYVALSPIYTLLWYLDKLLFPSYRHQEIKPVFIIGTPRSGTTFLHRTLASDEEHFFAIRHIEWRYPFIIIQKLILLFGLEKKMDRINYWSKSEAGAKAAKMHSQSLYDWEEDAVFFEERFLHHLFVMLRFPYRNLLTKLDDFQLLPHKHQQRIMNMHREVIQKIMYIRGCNKIYLSKEVASHTKLNLILKIYPQAKFIVNLRPSSDFLSSILKLIHLSTLSKTKVDIFSIDNFRSLYIERMRNDCLLLVTFLQRNINQQRISIIYDQLIKDVKSVVAYIYDQLELSLPPIYKNYLMQLHDKQQGRERHYEYEKENYNGFDEFDRLISKICNSSDYSSRVTAQFLDVPSP